MIVQSQSDQNYLSLNINNVSDNIGLRWEKLRLEGAGIGKLLAQSRLKAKYFWLGLGLGPKIWVRAQLRPEKNRLDPALLYTFHLTLCLKKNLLSEFLVK